MTSTTLLLSENTARSAIQSEQSFNRSAYEPYTDFIHYSLAYIAFKKGQNDLELIHITNENAMFKAQARYLLERADSEVWDYVLSPNNIHRRSLVDQVTSTAVPGMCSLFVPTVTKGWRGSRVLVIVKSQPQNQV